MKNCIVCRSKKIEVFIIVNEKIYWKCLFCLSKFLDKSNYVDLETERKHYLKHDNNIHGIGYRKFLSRLSNPLKNYISKHENGLDYGCGYAPALVEMLLEEGYNIECYDPYFFSGKNIFLKKYQFITCSEVVEHFFNPYEEFKKIDNILDANGYLAIMTCFMTDDNLFRDWYYRRDPTHVVFYNKRTFSVIASQMNWTMINPSKDIVFFKKSNILTL